MNKLNLIKNIYIYALSGITLIIFLVSITNTVTKIPEILYPNVYMQTYPDIKPTLAPEDNRTPEQIQQEIDLRNNQSLEQERLSQKKQMFSGAIWSVVSGVAFMFFHRERKAIEKSNHVA